MKLSTVILILLGLGGFAYIFVIFLYPALKGGMAIGGAPANNTAATLNALQSPANGLVSQGLAPMQSAAGTTGNLAITDGTSLLQTLLSGN
jgi:hypothetical protein